MPPSPPGGPLLNVRAALILFLAIVTAGLAAALSYLADRSGPSAGLVGASAFGAAVVFFNKIISA